jgi:hypothetical protein
MSGQLNTASYDSRGPLTGWPVHKYEWNAKAETKQKRPKRHMHIKAMF